MFCTKCGQKNPDNYKFCSRCGNPLKQPVIVEEAGVTETKKDEVKIEKPTETKSESLSFQDSIQENSPSTRIPNLEEEPGTPLNQYDEDGNLILPVYDEPKKSKLGIILGIIAAVIIIAGGIVSYHYYIESVPFISPYLKSKPEIEAKNFAKNFVDLLSYGNNNSIKNYYPDFYGDSLLITMPFDSKQIDVITITDGVYEVRLSPTVKLIFTQEKDDNYIVAYSKGLFNFPEEGLNLLRKSGIDYNNLTDKEIFNKINALKEEELKKSFTSPDLDFFNLHGKVKKYSCNVGVGGDYLLNGVIQFNKNGYWDNYTSVNVNGIPIISISRNHLNQIIKIERQYTENDEGDIIEYEWNRNQLSKVNGVGIISGHFSYNNNVISSFIFNELEYYNGEIIDYSNDIQYYNFKFDEKENWIYCTWKFSSNSLLHPDKNGEIIRVIEYY
ncbi:MAG: zinc ribbon domain-containing protein [Muribaculaceae bacterium]|nr:zinc ribbon domain-containing protein [Muribaculaceae bacterium]